ncbi:MAG: hypothetical protein IJK84_11270 [Bacteroidales bacterium]|nr:hypothetical protein [Bacteroidales bacterium]
MRKNNYLKCLCVAVALLATSFGASAQQFETSIYLNGIFPVGKFARSYEYNPNGLNSFVPMDLEQVATSAAPGLAATGRFGAWFDVGFGQLLPYAEVSFMWNSTKGSIRSVYDNNVLNDSAKSVAVTPTYFNIPITLGLKYRYDITPIVRPFAELGIGYDLMFITSNGYPTNSQITDKWYAYKPDGKLCWTAGIGTYLGEFVSVGLYYVGLGNHRIEYSSKAHIADVGDWIPPSRRYISQLGLRVGFHF